MHPGALAGCLTCGSCVAPRSEIMAPLLCGHWTLEYYVTSGPGFVRPHCTHSPPRARPCFPSQFPPHRSARRGTNQRTELHFRCSTGQPPACGPCVVWWCQLILRSDPLYCTLPRPAPARPTQVQASSRTRGKVFSLVRPPIIACPGVRGEVTRTTIPPNPISHMACLTRQKRARRRTNNRRRPKQRAR